MRTLIAAASLAALIASPACKSKQGKNGAYQGKPVEGKVPTEITCPDPEPPPRPVNEPPTMEQPVYEIVGVGQEIGFGIEVIDEESDEFKVELIEKPESARWDPYTLTVAWKPTAGDVGDGHFTARITETRRDTGEVRTFTHPFSIAVARKPQRLPVARPLGPVVETLITIHDVDRLAAVNKAWPLDAMLEAAARSMLADLPETEREDLEVADRPTLYRTFLAELARGHANKTLDPEAAEFDKALWGNPADWKIIAIRPRLDKKGHEVRIVYKAKAHAATYAMFRFRPLAHEAIDPAGVAKNNKLMAQMVVDAFFTEDGKPGPSEGRVKMMIDPALVRDEAAHAKKVEALVSGVINYKSAEDKPPVTFLALPTEARLGGGNKRDAEGNYVSGDAWGWTVMKPKPKDGKMVMSNIPIKGFVTGIEASDDGKSWEMVCGPAFDPKSDAHDPRIAKLCRETGHTDLPATGDGYAEAGADDTVVSSLVDAANLFVAFKQKAMVATVPLRDPRRDLFEEKGMSCHQCHVRKFGVRDYYDPAVTDPTAGLPRALNKRQDTTYFVITPTERWQPYAIDFQHKQECKIKAAIKQSLGLETSLGCPLKAE